MKKIYLSLVAVLVFALFQGTTQAQDTARIAFTGMNPHIGQHLYFRVVDKSNNSEVGRTSVLITVPDFTLGIGGIQAGSSYDLDFYADLNKNGKYDFPGDHTWRIILDAVKGDTTVPFSHNTNFTDISWVYQLTVALSNMNPHLGENFYFALKNKSGNELERKKLTETTTSYNVNFNGIVPDSSYVVDFFADHNKNGRYDPPATDHSWRISVDSVKGDTVVPFTHNTNFTTLDWLYKLTVNFIHMTPHLNQLFKLYLRDHATGAFIDSTILDPISVADFSINLFTIMPDSNYNVDFWADLSGNRAYDAPSTDHAWRIELLGVRGDTVIDFTHNTDFTDIGLGVITGITDIDGSGFNIYPNPATDELIIRSKQEDRNITSIKIYNAMGALVIDKTGLPGRNEVRINVSGLKPGMYLLSASDGVAIRRLKFLKQ
jgi:hypothetical protein